MERSRARSAPRGAALATATISALVVALVVVLVSATILVVSGREKGAEASRIQAQPGSLHWNERDRVTVLIMLSSGTSIDRAATTSMVIASYNPGTNSSAMLSIPQSLWVTIPGFGSDRIAEAYADGGAPLALQTVESVTHVAIPYYIVTGSAGLQQVVDAVGGIDVRVPYSAAGRSIAGQSLVAGMRHMDGATARAYGQIQTVDSAGEVGQMQRVRQVLSGIQRQVSTPTNLARVPSVLNLVGGSISTNFPFDQVQDLVRAIRGVPGIRVHSTQLDFGSGAVNNYGNGLLLPNWQRIQQIAQGLFPLRAGHRLVEVLNGTGIPGQASSIASWLQQAQIPIRGTASAPKYSYAQTQVIVRNNAGDQAMQAARAVSALLQAPLVIGSVAHTRAPVALIVGSDFQDLTQR